MFETFLRARRIVALAAVAVVLASTVLVSAFYRQVLVPCHGMLEAVPVRELPPAHQRHDIPGGDGVYLGPTGLSLATDCACKGELAFEAPPRENLGIYRNRETGLYVVRTPAGEDRFAFRRTDAGGHVFRLRSALDTSNVSMLILLGAAGALVGAYLLLRRAGSYALTMRDWRSARRRDDGVLEDENGAVVARLARHYFRDTDVLVNPKCIEGRSVYRELPLLHRAEVAPGSHAQWTTGTYRRFRDARVLAVLATLSTALAVGARFFAHV